MRVDMVPGHSYDLVSSEEMHGHMAGITAKMQEFIRQEVLGVKPVRFTSGVTLGITNPQKVVTEGPNAGYIWSILRISCSAPTAANAAVTIYRANDAGSLDLSAAAAAGALPYQVDFVPSANQNTAKTYSKGQLLLNAGEILVGSFAGAGVVGQPLIITGSAIEVPAEMIGKLLI